MQDIEHIDDLPASALFFRGYVEKNIALYQLIERRVNGFHIGAAAAVVQKAAVPLNRGESNLPGRC